MTRAGLTQDLPQKGEMIRALALDVDGTTINSSHAVSATVAEAVSRWRVHGGRVILTTARHPGGLRAIQERLDLVDDVFVSCQGALVGSWIGDDLQIHQEDALRGSDFDDLEHAAWAAGLSVGRFSGVNWWVRSLTPELEEEAAIVGVRPQVVTSFDDDHPIHKVLISGPQTPDAIEKLNALVQLVPESMTATFSHHNMMEITKSGIDKRHGLMKALHMHNLDLMEIAAIGDGRNDLGMLQAAGLSIAMGNAPHDVQAAADLVTKTNDEDGVAHAIDLIIEHYGGADS